MENRKKEQAFAQALEQVVQEARLQGNRLDGEQVEQAFADQRLSEEQLQLVYVYLKEHKIRIGEAAEPEEALEAEEQDYLSVYLDSLQALPVYSEGETQAAALSAMAGEKDGKQRLIESFLPQVPELARLYTGQGVLLEELIAEGNAALAAGAELAGCMESAEEVRGMLVRRMMEAMEELIGESEKHGRAGARLAEKINEVADQAKELAESLGRKVTAAELAEESGLTEKRIRDAMRLSGNKIEYLESE